MSSYDFWLRLPKTYEFGYDEVSNKPEEAVLLYSLNYSKMASYDFWLRP
jgi:hypothetical protein